MSKFVDYYHNFVFKNVSQDQSKSSKHYNVNEKKLKSHCQSRNN